MFLRAEEFRQQGVNLDGEAEETKTFRCSHVTKSNLDLSIAPFARRAHKLFQEQQSSDDKRGD